MTQLFYDIGPIPALFYLGLKTNLTEELDKSSSCFKTGVFVFDPFPIFFAPPKKF